jgi:hypothetical protein
MALFAVNLSEKIFIAIKALVEEGAYESLENFLEIAAFNQLALERGASPTEIIARGHRRCEGFEERADTGKWTGSRKATSDRPLGGSRQDRVSGGKRSTGRISRQVFVLDEKPEGTEVTSILGPFALVAPVETNPKPCDPVGAGDERVFGQVNRLLPLKLACRWVARWAYSLGDGRATTEWPAYSVIIDPLGDHAAKLGSLLSKWDAAADRKRDDQLATGLPRRGNSASRDRFLSQFLARITRAGDVYPGAICQYQLARFEGEQIALTHQGLQFALLKNPILESADASSSVALSMEETDFLVRQILDWAPRERDDMRIVLTAIAEGKVTPGALADAVQAEFSRDWTESMTLTHISGLVARLADLQMLRRRWQGRNVEYELGDRRRVDAFLKSPT